MPVIKPTKRKETQRLASAKRAVCDAMQSPEAARKEVVAVSQKVFFEFVTTRNRTIEESTTVVVEALPGDSQVRAEERLQDWIDEDYEVIEDLDWDQDDDHPDQPQIWSGKIIENFVPDLGTLIVPIEGETIA